MQKRLNISVEAQALPAHAICMDYSSLKNTFLSNTVFKMYSDVAYLSGIYCRLTYPSVTKPDEQWIRYNSIGDAVFGRSQYCFVP